ncbi:MAG: hypothetical protein ABEI13_01175 [Candidatus Paceibacteria bacterium]
MIPPSHIDSAELSEFIHRAYEAGQKQERQRILEKLEEKKIKSMSAGEEPAVISCINKTLDDIKEMLDGGLQE